MRNAWDPVQLHECFQCTPYIGSLIAGCWRLHPLWHVELLQQALQDFKNPYWRMLSRKGYTPQTSVLQIPIEVNIMDCKRYVRIFWKATPDISCKGRITFPYITHFLLKRGAGVLVQLHGPIPQSISFCWFIARVCPFQQIAQTSILARKKRTEVQGAPTHRKIA